MHKKVKGSSWSLKTLYTRYHRLFKFPLQLTTKLLLVFQILLWDLTSLRWGLTQWHLLNIIHILSEMIGYSFMVSHLIDIFVWFSRDWGREEGLRHIRFISITGPALSVYHRFQINAAAGQWSKPNCRSHKERFLETRRTRGPAADDLPIPALMLTSWR